MCDVLFVVPTFTKSIEDEGAGTLLLATILKQYDMNVQIYRLGEASLDYGFVPFLEKTVSNILSKSPSIISFYCRCDCYLANIQMAKMIKETAPHIPIVFAGPQADASSYETLENVPWVDFCCSGEGETTVYPLFSALLEGTDYTCILGLSYRNENNEIIENSKPPLIKDLNDLPIIDYSLIPKDTIEYSLANKFFPIEVGRGCPFNCAFCSTSIFWERKFRLKSNEIIIQEIEMLNKKYGAKKFKFRHDLFTANKKRIIDFCYILKEKKLNIEWKCSSRIDTLDEESITEMCNAGLIALYIGVETGSERMQKITHKNLRIDDVIRVSQILAKHKVSATFSFIYGFPEETEDDIEATLKLASKLLSMGHKNLQFHLYAMLLGTEYYEKYKNELVFSAKHSNIVGSLGTEEFIDYINENKSVFPFYYEYDNPIRKKYANLENCALISLMYYDMILKLLPNKIDSIKILDIYLAIRNSNTVFFENNPSSQECHNNRFSLYQNASYQLFSDEDAHKLDSIFSFYKKHNLWLKNENSVSEVHYYNVDIKALLAGAQLDKIAFTDTMVYLNKNGDKKQVVAVNLQKMN